MSKKEFLIEENFDGERLDNAICELLEQSRSHCQKLIKEGKVLVNGSTAKSSKTLRFGDTIFAEQFEVKEIEATPEDIEIDIVYEDSDLIVVNKSQGMVVHPAVGSYSGTLVNALLFHIKDLSGINGQLRPGIVHRLDKDTSGLLVVAKNDKAHNSLAEQIATKVCKRTYVALLEGVMKQDGGSVDKPIGRGLSDRKKMDIVYGGRDARTDFLVLERFKNHTLAQFQLHTGRTHQIRVHAKFLGFPVVGDKVYGFKTQKFNLDGQMLHSKQLSFYHPTTKEWMTFDSALPSHFEKILSVIKC